jgi:UDPglucose 6-dehydrogenase
MESSSTEGRIKYVFIGAGWVGGLTSSFFASRNPQSDFYVYDINQELIAKWNNKVLPFFEEGLQALLDASLNRNLFFTNDKVKAFEGGTFFFICVNTPTKTKGIGKGEMHDLKYVEACTSDLADYWSKRPIERCIAIIEKSTVSPRTCDLLSTLFKEAQTSFPENKSKFCVMSNPEFLAEGVAVKDLSSPDRVIIGAGSDSLSQEMASRLASLYTSSVPGVKIISTATYTSELSKLVSNAMLAQRVSSINSLSMVCESLGIDVDHLAACAGSDSRIGSKYLKASPGFGGSCLEKDLLELAYLARSLGLEEVAEYWKAVYTMNQYQKRRIAELVVREMHGTISGKKISILGVAFKKDTSDCRSSPAITVIRHLLEEGCFINVYDPQAKKDEFVREFCNYLVDEILTSDILSRINFHESAEKACAGSHAAILLTEWDEFKTLDLAKIFESMKKPAYFIDTRGILSREELSSIGFKAYKLGLGFSQVKLN